MIQRGRLLAGALTILSGACTERVAGPGSCPDYCPVGTLELSDTLIFPVGVGTDSSYRGFVRADETSRLQIVSRGDTLTSRGILQFEALPDSAGLTGDATLRPITGIDSVRVQLLLVQRDTLGANQRLDLYRLPPGLDSGTTYADLDSSFSPSNLLASMVVDSVLPPDTITGAKQTSGTLIGVIPGSAVSFVPAEEGVLALGVAASTDVGLPFAVLGSLEALAGAVASYYVSVDSAGDTAHTTIARPATFDSFVFAPPTTAPLELEVGGVPSARSILRFVFPAGIVDTGRIVRATLLLIPTEPVAGVPGDSFFVSAHAVAVDFGAKSPLATDPDSILRGQARLAPGTSDTAGIELTALLRFWGGAPQVPRALMLRVVPEGGGFGAVRFGSTGAPGFEPAMRVSFFRPFPFGTR